MLTCGRRVRSTACSIACAAWQLRAFTFHSLQGGEEQRGCEQYTPGSGAGPQAGAQPTPPTQLTHTAPTHPHHSPNVLQALAQVFGAPPARQAPQDARPLGGAALQRLAHHRQQAPGVPHLEGQGGSALVIVVLRG